MSLTDIPGSGRTDIQEAVLRIREMVSAHAHHGRNVMENVNSIVNIFGIDAIKEGFGDDASDLDVWYAASRDATMSATKTFVPDLSTKTERVPLNP